MPPRATTVVDNALLTKLTDKVDDHDKSLMMMAKTMEDINKILGDFAKNIKTYQDDQIQHWKNQDRNASQVEAILKQLADGSEKFRIIEQRQHEGCPSMLSHQKESNQIIISCREKEQTITSDLKEQQKQIDALETQVTTLKVQQEVNVKKIENLETQRNWGAGLLITSFFGLIVTVIKLAMGVK